MTGRSLAYLNGIPIEQVKGLTGKRGQALRKAELTSVSDLLLHTPRRYLDRSAVTPIASLPIGEEVTVMGRVLTVSTRRPRRNLTIVEAEIGDETGSLRCTWFNQAFRGRQLSQGSEVAISGKLEVRKGRRQMNSPAVDMLTSDLESLVTGRVVPIHPSVGEVGPGHMRRAIHNALLRSRPIADPVPEDILDRIDVIERDEAIANIHFPDSMADLAPAQRRLIFDEFFRLEVALALNKQRMIDQAKGFSHQIDPDAVRSFLTQMATRMKLAWLAEDDLPQLVAAELAASLDTDAVVESAIDAPLDDLPAQADSMTYAFAATLPFPPTNAQIRTIHEIMVDLVEPHPMHRLLQGEVGSGKTLVALFALLAAVGSGYQTAVMAPTEVLAEQHFLGISNLLAVAGMTPASVGADDFGMDSLFVDEPGEHQVSLALLTANHAEVNFRPPGTTRRDDLVGWIASGKIDIAVGTHALIQEGVRFDRLGLAVVDEQHRFGVHQRVSLKEKAVDVDPDLLIMTATPIPRTLSMTLYGDLDVSVLDEMPPGRPPVETRVIDPLGLSAVYEEIRREVGKGRQVFYVCPLVEDSAKIEAASATAEYQRLQGVFPDLRLGLLHGQMPSKDKEATMARFRDGEIDVLVATTVIEVGIDISNASMMVIQDADRFGLSQLHQLRGRVGRGAHASSCVLVADPTTDEGEARLAAMVATTDGFRLAEEDLRIRGQGTIFDARQSGMADLRLADILRDTDLLIAARREAFALVKNDPELRAHQALRDEIQELLGNAVEWLFVS
ncbi:MAG: ATP-dependent DNA helicase RecG [Acidimicrobiia bacterium]